jgi:hypothetical protein
MGLDAYVFCNCAERGLLRTLPRSEWSIRIDETGARFAQIGGAEICSLKDDLGFHDWDAHACDHHRGVLLHHRIGNISAVGAIRAELSKHAASFPLILSRVVYNGMHAGDYLPIDTLPQLEREVDLLGTIQSKDKIFDEVLRHFERVLAELVVAAKSVGKPISF